MIKRRLIKQLDDDILRQAYSIVKRDIPGILAHNYKGIPVVALYTINSVDNSRTSSSSTAHVPSSEFLRLVANSGVDDHDVYENTSTNDMFVEQQRRDSKSLRDLGKYIAISADQPMMIEKILWKNTLKEILQIQSSNLDELQNQSILQSIQKTRRSLHSQRLQLHHNSSVYDLITTLHDQEQEFNRQDSESLTTGLIWEPWPGKTLEYYEYGLESVKWQRDQIADQIPRLKEAYQFARDEFSDHTLLNLQRLAICLEVLAIAVPILQIGLERTLNYFVPAAHPSSQKAIERKPNPSLGITPSSQGSSNKERKTKAELNNNNSKLPPNKPMQGTADHK